MNFIILPNQLFNKKYLDKKNTYYIWENPHYFKDYKYNKKKLILHRASMKSYYDYLVKNKYKVEYCEFSSNNINKIMKKQYKIFNPINKIKLLKLKGKYTIIDTPNLLLTQNMCDEYRKKTDKYLFNNFYMWSKQQLNIIPNVKSKDKDNRKKIPKNMKIPSLKSLYSKNKYVDEAITYINKHFKNNYGNTNNFFYPIDHKMAEKWLDDFIKNKFSKFGDYQDYIKEDNEFLFHSILSSSINIGLINPSEILEKIKKYKNKVTINNYEGYVRQLFWREYQRYTYLFIDFKKLNYFNYKKKLNNKWYTGNLNVLPVDNAIKTGFDYGYLHHINRLMVMGNYMSLSEIQPIEGFKWFMEFSCDSYEWVMCQNVFDMVFFVTGGSTMRRPYVSSSNYVVNMSSYKKDKWCDTWNNLYEKFKKKYKKKLWKFRYFFAGLK